MLKTTILDCCAWHLNYKIKKLIYSQKFFNTAIVSSYNCCQIAFEAEFNHLSVLFISYSFQEYPSIRPMPSIIKKIKRSNSFDERSSQKSLFQFQSIDISNNTKQFNFQMIFANLSAYLVCLSVCYLMIKNQAVLELRHYKFILFEIDNYIIILFIIQTMYFNIPNNFVAYCPQNASSHTQEQRKVHFQQNYFLWLQNSSFRQKHNGLVEKIKSLKVENTKLARQNRYLRQQQSGDYSVQKRHYKSRNQMKRYQPKQVNLIHTRLQMFLSSPGQYYLSLLLQNSQILKENQVLTAQNVRLEEEVKECIKENKVLTKLKTNYNVKIQVEGDYKIFKRTYRPRRQGLIKNISCQYPGCLRKYSSFVALRNHERQYHGMMLKVKQEEKQSDLIK